MRSVDALWCSIRMHRDVEQLLDAAAKLRGKEQPDYPTEGPNGCRPTDPLPGPADAYGYAWVSTVVQADKGQKPRRPAVRHPVTPPPCRARRSGRCSSSAASRIQAPRARRCWPFLKAGGDGAPREGIVEWRPSGTPNGLNQGH